MNPTATVAQSPVTEWQTQTCILSNYLFLICVCWATSIQSQAYQQSLMVFFACLGVSITVSSLLRNGESRCGCKSLLDIDVNVYFSMQSIGLWKSMDLDRYINSVINKWLMQSEIMIHIIIFKICLRFEIFMAYLWTLTVVIKLDFILC